MKITVKKPTKEEIKIAELWPTWSKEPSEFEWEYAETETCYILKGEASVSSNNGEERASFGAGDWVVFEKGLKCVWKIEKTIKKHYNFG